MKHPHQTTENTWHCGQILFWMIVVLGALSFSGCEGEEGSVVAVDPVQLSIYPENISFEATLLGDTTRNTITIQNLTGVEAKITLKIEETITSDDQNREFALAEDSPYKLQQEFSLTDGNPVFIDVVYAPKDEVADTGALVVSFNGVDSPFRIPLETQNVSPNIDGPTRVIFGRVPEGGHAQKNVTIQNVGAAPLNIEDMIVDDSSDFSICFPASAASENCPSADNAGVFPANLTPLQTLTMRVNYDPLDAGEDTGVIRILSNDPDTPSYAIDLNGNGTLPCIVVTDENGLDFGTGFIGGVTSRTMTISNCSPNKELVVNHMEMINDAGGVFFLDDFPGALPEGELTIPVDETASFTVNFAPEEMAASEGVIQIQSNDDAKSPLEIPVFGTGDDNECPTPIARAREVGTNMWSDQLESIPLRTLEFDGTQSSDPNNPNGENNGISRYEWTIIQRPPDSTTQFTPNNAEPNPQLFLDLAGAYIVELRVFDEQGAPSCETQRVTILATPDEDIHVQLVWDTPGDPDQTDSGTGTGSDLDLHFLHPRGNWNSSPWDCYWRNPVTNWGELGGADDPSLDIDDTDGSGPENVNLNNPEEIGYRVGVHYFSDHNYGPSYATLRIYLSRVLVFEYRDKYLESTGKFWEVASIDWGPNPRVGQIDQVYGGFP